MSPVQPAELPAPVLKRTPLYDVHRAAGARLVPFAGWEMPVQYAGVIPEVRAVRGGVGIFDVSHMGRVRVGGADAEHYLTYLTVNDVSRLPAAGGAAQYSLLCREAGGVIDDIIVYRVGPSSFVVVVNASNHDKDLAWMRGHAVAFPDLILDDETEDTALIAVQGPAAVALVDGLSDRDLAVVPRFGVEETTVAGIQAMAARTGYTGEDGYELFCHADHATLLWQALANGGAVPCGLGARDTLRLEAALPLYGHEMDETVHPFEARLGWVVRLDKDADFLGKTALRDLQGAPRARTLVGLAMGDRAVPRDGYDLFAGEARVGHVTSGTFSPTLGKGIALARIEAARVANDRPLDVMIRGVRHPARTVKLPFYKNV